MSTIPPDIEALDEAMVAALGDATSKHIRAVIDSHVDYVIAHQSDEVAKLAAAHLSNVGAEMQARAIGLLTCIGVGRDDAIRAVATISGSHLAASLDALDLEAPLQ